MSSEPAVTSKHADTYTQTHTTYTHLTYIPFSFACHCVFLYPLLIRVDCFPLSSQQCWLWSVSSLCTFGFYCVCNNSECTFTWYSRKCGFIKTTRRSKHLLWSTNYIKGSTREARTEENYHCINKLQIYFMYILYFLHSQKVLGLNQGWGLSLWHFHVSPACLVFSHYEWNWGWGLSKYSQLFPRVHRLTADSKLAMDVNVSVSDW